MKELTAEEMVRQLYLGVFEREPDENGWKHYSEQIRNGKSISDVINSFTKSKEFKNKYLPKLSVEDKDEIEESIKIFQDFLYRNPDSEEEAKHFALMSKYELIKHLTNNVEFQERFMIKSEYDDFELEKIWQVANKTFYIFLHPNKCAGSSLDFMLSKAFGQKIPHSFGLNIQIFNPYYLYDKVYTRTHLDYDTVNNFMIGKKIYFTFLRNPLKRFLSQYYYIRIRSDIFFKRPLSKIISNTNNIKEFLLSIEYQRPFYNQQAFITMGFTKWNEWKTELSELKGEQKTFYIEEYIRPFVKQRLSEFLFVGIQEKFEESVKLLFSILGKDLPDTIIKTNTLEQQIQRQKKSDSFKKEEITPEIEQLIEPFIEIDKVVYEEGLKVYENFKASFENKVKGRISMVTNKTYTIDEILENIYIGLLNRMPDEGGLNSYRKALLNGVKISDIIKSIRNSQEFFMKQHDSAHHMLYGGHISYAYENPATVFIHIPKTAGQSLHWLFKQKVGENKVSPLFNNLYTLPVNFAYSYDVIFGHTDYEAVKLIVQRKEVKLITFLRDPVKRLISLYKFWWSHDPEFHKGNTAVDLANKYTIEEFFKAEEVKRILWNDMFGRFMGYKFKDTVKDALNSIDESKKQFFIHEKILPLIKEKIEEEYFFIGLQEQFNEDVCKMFKKLGFECSNEDIQNAKVNITDNNVGKPGFKKEKPSFEITEGVLNSIKELTELDLVLYNAVKQHRQEKEKKGFAKLFGRKIA